MPQSGSSRDLLSPPDPAGEMRWLPSTPDISALRATWEQSDGSIENSMLMPGKDWALQGFRVTGMLSNPLGHARIVL